MIVITLNNCPPSLRGDLSKWLLEVNTGVYVGQVSAKVRDAIWKRVCENVESGKATMVYSALNEQHMEFKIYNTRWKIKDYDGIKLVKRPFNLDNQEPNNGAEELKYGFSKASKQLIAKRVRKSKSKLPDEYIVLDVETSGLDYEKDSIIEIGLMSVEKGKCIQKWDKLIKTPKTISTLITEYTGITNEMCTQNGIDITDAANETAETVRGKTVIIYNAQFDINFLQSAYKKAMPMNRIIDVMVMARKKIYNIRDYKLSTVAKYFGITEEQKHRALSDCELLNKVFLKLNEIN